MQLALRQVPAIRCCFALLLVALAGAAGLRPTQVRAGDAAPDAALYLDQAQSVLVDARTQMESLQFYLPLGSVKDANDPTWSSAEESAESLSEDRDSLQTLSPPDDLATLNADLVAALTRASASAEAAIDSLTGGDAVAGQASVITFDQACADVERLASALPGP